MTSLFPGFLVFPFAGPKFFMVSLVAAIVYILESPLHQVFFVVDSVTTSEKVKLKYNEIPVITSQKCLLAKKCIGN